MGRHLALSGLGLCLLSSPAWAHGGSEHRLALSLYESSVRVRATPPVSVFSGVDSDGDGHLSAAELAAGEQAVVAQFVEGLGLADGLGIRAVLTEVRSVGVGHGAHHLELNLLLDWDASPAERVLTYGFSEDEVSLFVRQGQDVVQIDLAPGHDKPLVLGGVQGATER